MVLGKGEPHQVYMQVHTYYPWVCGLKAYGCPMGLWARAYGCHVGVSTRVSPPRDPNTTNSI